MGQTMSGFFIVSECISCECWCKDHTPIGIAAVEKCILLVSFDIVVIRDCNQFPETYSAMKTCTGVHLDLVKVIIIIATDWL